MTERPSVEVAVIMRRERIDNRWQPWRWVLADVVPQEPAFGSEPRILLKSDDEERWLHPGFTVELFRDDAEGYYLNVTTPAPCWFVLWRMEEEATVERRAAGPRPTMVSLSYHDAGRWLDAQETVEQVPAPAARRRVDARLRRRALCDRAQAAQAPGKFQAPAGPLRQSRLGVDGEEIRRRRK